MAASKPQQQVRRKWQNRCGRSEPQYQLRGQQAGRLAGLGFGRRTTVAVMIHQASDATAESTEFQPSSGGKQKAKQQAATVRLSEPTPPKQAEFLTPSQIAARYPLSTDTIYTACKDGLLTHYRVPSRQGKRGKYLIAEVDFRSWLESTKRVAGEAHEEEEDGVNYL